MEDLHLRQTSATDGHAEVLPHRVHLWTHRLSLPTFVFTCVYSTSWWFLLYLYDPSPKTSWLFFLHKLVLSQPFHSHLQTITKTFSFTFPSLLHFLQLSVWTRKKISSSLLTFAYNFSFRVCLHLQTFSLNLSHTPVSLHPRLEPLTHTCQPPSSPWSSPFYTKNSHVTPADPHFHLQRLSLRTHQS